MNNIISSIQQLEQSTFENLRNSKAKNTSRAYSSDYKDFVCFCKRYNFPFMPSNAKTISLYLTHLGKNFNRCQSSFNGTKFIAITHVC